MRKLTQHGGDVGFDAELQVGHAGELALGGLLNGEAELAGHDLVIESDGVTRLVHVRILAEGEPILIGRGEHGQGHRRQRQGDPETP